jgi:uncharacterized membrane-anchored protein
LFRHYWVLFKLLLTAVATIVLLLKLGPITYLADVAAETTFSSADLIGLRTSLMAHAAGGLLVLLAVATLAVYKPRGMTRYGLREERERGSTPRWVKVFGVVVIALILLLGIMTLGGGHGPGAHVPSGG